MDDVMDGGWSSRRCFVIVDAWMDVVMDVVMDGRWSSRRFVVIVGCRD